MEKNNFLDIINQIPVKINKKMFVEERFEDFEYARKRGVSWKDLSKIIKNNFDVDIEWNMLSNYFGEIKRAKGNLKSKKFNKYFEEADNIRKNENNSQESSKNYKTKNNFIKEPEKL